MPKAWKVELDLLVQAVQATSDGEAAELAQRFCAQRQRRRGEQGLASESVEYERRLEWVWAGWALK